MKNNLFLITLMIISFIFIIFFRKKSIEGLDTAVSFKIKDKYIILKTNILSNDNNSNDAKYYISNDVSDTSVTNSYKQYGINFIKDTSNMYYIKSSNGITTTTSEEPTSSNIQNISYIYIGSGRIGGNTIYTVKTDSNFIPKLETFQILGTDVNNNNIIWGIPPSSAM